MRKTLLVTGLTGFVGRNLQRLFATEPAPTDAWNLLQPEGRCDVQDSAALAALLERHEPDAVLHLAGQTFVPEALRDPARTLQVNLLGTLNLLQGLKHSGFNGTFLYVSSGDVYGQVAEDALPISETLAPQPRNPYAVSKAAAELLCRQWSHVEPWRIVVARAFNHIGAGQEQSFVVANMARQIARVRLGLQAPCLEVGDIDVTRDFLDVQDVIAAYLLLLQKGRNGEIYNVCSGRERRVRDLIVEMAGLAEVEVELVQDPARMRRAEQRRVVGSAEKLHRETGWKPAVNITETLRRVLSDWDARERPQ
jgi:GDP-4-dehydro-6-deoxy-D-mannose reductase